MQQKIIILDFGSQTTQLIGRPRTTPLSLVSFSAVRLTVFTTRRLSRLT